VQDDDYQGELKFTPIPWKRVLWDDRTGGNHFFFSILQKLTMDTWRSVKGLPDWAFDETISRLPLLFAGMASIMVFALFLSWMGRPVAGLFGALWFTLHPWHVRYSTEARGYILMMFFLILAVWCLWIAMREQRWRWWTAVGVTQFLAIYSWKVAALPLLCVDVLALCWMLRRVHGPLRARIGACLRLITVCLSMTALFSFLYMPPLLQSARALVRLQTTGKPMNTEWLRNSVSLLITGTPWERASQENPTEVPLRERAEGSLQAALGVSCAVGFLLLGLARLWRESPTQTVIYLSIILAAAAGAALFKWKVRIEWITWYFFFLIFPLGIMQGIGLEWLVAKVQSMWRRARSLAAVCGGGLVLAAGSVCAVKVPQIQLMDWQPYESHQEAFYLTRGRHEPLGYAGVSKVKTCYLWRHIYLYDPRGDHDVRTEAQLRQLMEETQRTDGELYYVVGMRGFFADMQKEVYAILNDQQYFEKLATLWAEEEIHTLEIYRYRRAEQ
jgi:hypothetical protein